MELRGGFFGFKLFKNWVLKWAKVLILLGFDDTGYDMGFDGEKVEFWLKNKRFMN